MSHGELDPSVLAALRSQLKAPQFGVQYPIRLTARTPYLSGRAALVFVSPHFLSPADDAASFGIDTLDPEEGTYGPPYQDARIVAWFRPPEAGRKYNVDFSILVSPGSSYSLASDGGTETMDYGDEVPAYKLLSTTFFASSSDWLSFTLSGTNYWRLDYCELNQLP
jgi:hypothetical protein